MNGLVLTIVIVILILMLIRLATHMGLGAAGGAGVPAGALATIPDNSDYPYIARQVVRPFKPPESKRPAGVAFDANPARRFFVEFHLALQRAHIMRYAFSMFRAKRAASVEPIATHTAAASRQA